MTSSRSGNAHSDLLTVSIAMATYNGEKFIEEQLESIALQTRRPDELIVSDDGSTDQTLQIVEAFAKNAPFPVKIMTQQKRLGFADNFLTAVSNCSSEIISFCDQDDRWEPTKLSICMQEFSDPDVSLCVHSARVWRDGDSKKEFFPGFRFRTVWYSNSTDPLNVYPGFAMLVRRRILKLYNHENRPGDIHVLSNPEVKMAHDKWAWFLSSIFGKIVCIPDVLASYRQHGQNTCGVGNEKSLLEKLLTSARTTDYLALSKLCSECADFLAVLPNCNEATLKHRAEFATRLFGQRSKYCISRNEIYGRRVNFLKRFRIFLIIACSGGYIGSPSKASMGWRAGLKDLLVGVFGIWRAFEQ